MIVGLDGGAIGTGAATIVGDDGGEAEDEARGQLTVALEVDFEAREVAGLELRERVEHDGGDGMVDVGIVETLEDVGTELLQLGHGEVKGLHEFAELHLADILAYDFVVEGIAYDVDA